MSTPNPKTNPDCPARLHGTMSAHKKPPLGSKCICPEALAAMDRYNTRERERQKERRDAGEACYDADDHGRVEAPDFPSPDIPEIPIIGIVGRRVLRADHALCRSFDSDLWFSAAPHERAEAKQVCRACPVVDDCLTFALQHPYEGVWGGCDEHERAAIRATWNRPRTPTA